MRNFFIFLIVATGIVSCDRNGTIDNPTIMNSISFPEPPIEIMSNIDSETTAKDCVMLNWYNIVQVNKNLYYMWYAALGSSSGESDIDQGLFFAYSNDAFHWRRVFPNGADNTIVSKGIQEQYVFRVSFDNSMPFRMIANVIDKGKFKLCMWSSQDGYSWEMDKKKVLLDDLLHDTQNVMIEREGKLNLYTRLWNKTNTNRRNGICEFDFSGNLLTQLDTLAGDYLYNAATSYLDNKYDLLLPTYMNNKEGDSPSDNTYIKSYLCHKKEVVEVDNDFNRWLKPDEKWVSFAPGFLEVDGKTYLSYMTCTWSHDSKRPSNGVTRYYLIRVEMTIDGKKIN